MFRGNSERIKQQQQQHQLAANSPSRATSGGVSISSANNNGGLTVSDTEEVSLPAVEMFFRNLDLGDQEDAKHGKEEDSDWEEDDDDDDDDDDEGINGPTGAHDARQDGDLDGEGSKKDLDENQDDEDGGEDNASLGGMNDSALPNAGGQSRSSAAAGLASTFKKIGVFVKRELNKRKTGGGSRRTMAKVQIRKKETQELTGVHCVQRLAAHSGPIWVMECSPAPGLYMATGGKDGKIVVWEMQVEGSTGGGTQEGTGGELPRGASSSTTSGSPMHPFSPSGANPYPAPAAPPAPAHSPSHGFVSVLKSATSPTTSRQSLPQQAPSTSLPDDHEAVAGVIVTGPSAFKPKPYRVYFGHTSDVIALSWSQSLFLASGSTDKTCRIWHISAESCLCVLKHPDFVAAVDFHPLDDSLLLTGCFDKKLRFWDVAQGAVSQRVQCQSFITACRFNQSGDMAVAGLYTGHCVFYQMAPYGYGKAVTAGMKYYTQIECRNKTGMQKKGRKVTSLRFITVAEKHRGTEAKPQEYMLVTTNESRSRLYNMDDFSLVCKYRGATNSSMLQIGATCSEDGRHIICGSEDRSVVVWRLKNDLVKTIFGGQGRRDMCDTYESFHACSSGPVTAACFAPEYFIRARKARTSDYVSPKHSSSVVTTGGNASSNGAGADEDSSDFAVAKSAASLTKREALESAHDELDRATNESPDSQIILQAEDDVGLGGALIFAAGYDGVVGVFEISSL